MTYKEIYETSLSETKRREEKFKIYERFIGRPISIFLTKPLLNTNVSPTTVTKVSVLACVIGFVILILGDNMVMSLLGWLFFFVWGELDGVDGNIARCKNQCSLLGDLWDTMGGYTAMVLIYFSAGILAFHDNNLIDFTEKYWYIVIGGMTAVFSIFPRLMLHKKKSSVKDAESVKQIADKRKFGVSQIVLMNLVAPSGGLQVIFFLAIVFHVSNIFVAFYFLINMAIMLVSLSKLLKDEN